MINNFKASDKIGEAAHKEVSYTVKSEDTLWKIVLKYNTTYQEIAKVTYCY